MSNRQNPNGTPVDGESVPSERSEFLVFGSPLIGEEEITEVVDSMRSGWIGSGPKVQRFERMLEDYLGVEHVRCTSSCTAALILSMRVLGVGGGDEVIVPAMTFVASANAVEHTGAKPVLVDCEPHTGLMDLDAAEAAINERTKAIMPVHLAGAPMDLDRLNALRDRHGLLIIEDAAHAIGAEWRGTRIGAHGNLAAFSFYVTKNITTAEGGAIATNDPAVAEAAERLALHGLSLGAWQRFSDAGFKHYEVVEPGFKFNMTDLHAALGLHQLPRLDGWIEQRAELWDRYDELLADLALETPPPPCPDTRHARHLYYVQIGEDARRDRDEVLAELQQKRIGCGVHYRGVHLHPYYRERYSLRPDDFPVATDMSMRTMSLPLSPKVTERDQHDVASALREAVGKRRLQPAPDVAVPGRLAAKRVLITGGCGFVGSNMAAELLSRGAHVVLLDDLSRGSTERNLIWLRNHPNAGRLEFCRGDVRSESDVTAATRGVDSIVHLASQAAVTTSLDDPRGDFEINAIGTLNVLEAARGMDPQPTVLYASTNKVYGGMEHEPVVLRGERYDYRDLTNGVPESQPLDFHSPYGCSKGAGDQYTRDYARIYGVPTVVFRMSCIYGPRQFGTEDQGWLAHFTISALEGRSLNLCGDGCQVRDALFVSDAVAAYIAALERIDEVAGQTFNLGGGRSNTVSLLELIALLEERLGIKVERSFGPPRPGDQRVFYADIRKASQLLGWAPSVSVSSGIGDLIDWIRESDAFAPPETRAAV